MTTERSAMSRETEHRHDGKDVLQQRNAKEAVYAILGRCEVSLFFFFVVASALSPHPP